MVAAALARVLLAQPVHLHVRPAVATVTAGASTAAALAAFAAGAALLAGGAVQDLAGCGDLQGRLL